MTGIERTLRKTRFAQTPEWVLRHPELCRRPVALALYGHLALLADYKTRVTTSDWRELATATGWAERTIMRSMKVLRDAGVILREGSFIVLPMDPPTAISGSTAAISGSDTDKSGSGDRHICQSGLPHLSSTPLSTENSEFLSRALPKEEEKAHYQNLRSALATSGHQKADQ